MSQPLNLDALERDALTHGKLSWKDAHALVSHARSLAYQIARLQAAAPSASTEKCFKCGHPAHSDSCVNVAPSAQQVEQLPVELRAVAETVAKGGGFWTPCTGCYDTEDGRPTQKYAHSDVFGCELGNGCRECGGLGAVWDDTDYAAMAEFMEQQDTAPALSASPAPVAGKSLLVTLARENTALLDALVYVAHMMHAEPQHRCCKGLTLIDNNAVEVKLPDGRVVGGYESPTAPLYAATDDRPVIKPLKEPVSVEKAMLAGRTARAETSVQGTTAVFLVNIQIAGWTESKEYAEGFARGFNLAAKWMESALRGHVPVGYRLQPISEFDSYQDVLRDAERFRWWVETTIAAVNDDEAACAVLDSIPEPKTLDDLRRGLDVAMSASKEGQANG